MKTSNVRTFLFGAMVALSVAACGGSVYDPRMGGGSNETSADAGNTADAATTDNAVGDAGTVPVDPTLTTTCGPGTHIVMEGSLGTCVVDAADNPAPTVKQFCLDRNGNSKLDCDACVFATTSPGSLYKERLPNTECELTDAATVDTTPDAGNTTTDAGTPPVEVVCGAGTVKVGNTCEVAPPPATDGGTTTTTTTDAGTPAADAGTNETDAGTNTTADAGTTTTTTDAGTPAADAGTTTTSDAGTTTTTCPAGQHLNNGACVNDAPPSGPCTFTVSVPATYDNLRATFSLDPSGQVSGWPCSTTGSVLTCTAPAVGTTVYVQANLTAGNHWLCDGFSDAGDTASHLTTSVTITGCGYTNVTPYHKPSAINTDGCAGRAIPATP